MPRRRSNDAPPTGADRRPPAKMAPPEQGARARSRRGYRLVVGAYLHPDPMPEELAGHSFIAIEEPNGARRVWGFSPAGFSKYDPNRDVEQLRAGVPGVVHDDSRALDKPGVRTLAYRITAAQAQAARDKVEEYATGKHRFSLEDRQCSAFALDVMRAAGVPLPDTGDAPTPHIMYQALEGEGRSPSRATSGRE